MKDMDEVSKLLAREGFNIKVDADGNLSLEPTALRLNQIRIKLVKRGRYVADPQLVPAELADKNILWIEEPPKVTAITLMGEEIPVFVESVFTEYEERHPDDEA